MRQVWNKTIFTALVLSLGLFSCKSTEYNQDLNQSGVHASDVKNAEIAIEEAAAEGVKNRIAELQTLRTAILETPGEDAANLRKSEQQLKTRLDPSAKALSQPLRLVGEALRPLMQTESLRAITEAYMQDELINRSERLKTSLLSAKGSSTVYDYVVVGTGPLAATTVEQIYLRDPGAKILVIGANKLAGGQFSEAGSSFNYNSGTSRPATGKEGGNFGKGDINPISKAIRLTDITYQTFSPASLFGRVATAVFYTYPSDILQDSRVTSIKEGKTQGSSTLTVKITKEDGSTKNVKITSRVATYVAPGLGQPIYGFKVQTRYSQGERATTLKRGFEKEFYRSNARIIMPIMDFNMLLAYNQKNPTNPFEPYGGRSLAVFGGGDTGKVVMELLTGISTNDLGATNKQLDSYKRLTWFTGKNGVQSCLDVLYTYRSRYVTIGGALKAENVNAILGRVQKVEVIGGKNYITEFIDYSKNPKGELIKLKPGSNLKVPRVNFSKVNDAGTYETKAELERAIKKATEYVKIPNKMDYIINAVGYSPRPTLLGIFKEKVWNNLASRFTIRSSQDGTKLGRSVAGTNATIIGAANEGALPNQTLISDKEAKGISENKVSLAIWTAKTRKLISESINRFQSNPSETVRTMVERERVFRQERDYYSEQNRKSSNFVIEVSQDTQIKDLLVKTPRTTSRVIVGNAEAQIKAQLNRLFSKYEILGQSEVKLGVSRSTGEKTRIVIEGIEANSKLLTQLEAEFSRQPRLLMTLESAIVNANAGSYEISLTPESNRLRVNYTRLRVR